MKTSTEQARETREKHTESFSQDTPLVCILDARGRTLWHSDDPKDTQGYFGSSILEMVAGPEKKRVMDFLSQCVLEGETVEYDVIGQASVYGDRDEMVSWRVKMWPANYAHGIAAACCVCYRLDPAYQEIKEDEITLLKLLCQDCTLIEVAHRMLLSESAIDSKIKKLKEKLRCHNIGGLVAAAMNGGVLLN